MSERAPLMTRAERRVRARRILDQLKAGEQPATIAKDEGLTISRVRGIGASGGIGEPREARQSPVWDMDDDRRREAFSRRAAAGARLTRSGETI